MSSPKSSATRGTRKLRLLQRRRLTRWLGDGISADGKVCYAYHYGLTNARRHLQELGAPEPQLPPFDESKFEPLPDVELNPKDEFWVDPDQLDSQ